jgi:hypothetical protein
LRLFSWRLALRKDGENEKVRKERLPLARST